MKTYKAVSTVIATLLMLIITIALAGTAYFYINSITSQATSVVIKFDPGLTFCDGTTNTINVGVRNQGTDPVNSATVDISGRDASANPIVGGPCEAAPGNLIPAGTSGSCTVTLAGSDGSNTLIASAGGTTETISIFCS